MFLPPWVPDCISKIAAGAINASSSKLKVGGATVQNSFVPLFRRYIGIDYSGAETIDSPLPGLRVYLATPASEPVEIHSPVTGKKHKHWTRQMLAHWLANQLLDNPATIVGIDHAFSFPMQYFHAHGVSSFWERFLEDFEAHWPTREPHTFVDFVREEVCGRGAERAGDPKWRRLCDVRSGGKSVFHFDVPGSVAKSTHAGLPWLRYLREQLGKELHFWPFDGWVPEEHQSVVAEVYPALWKDAYPTENRDPHQHDAYAVARWLREADADDQLLRALHPPLPRKEQDIAATEGWILGLDVRAEEIMPKKNQTKRGAEKKPQAKAGKTGPTKPTKPTKKAAKISRARERIHEFVDKFHGKLVTPRQLFFLEATLGSLDDTLDENEVLSILEAMPPDFSMIPRDELRLIHIDADFKISTYPAPPYPHDPDEYCRRHPRR